MSLSATLRLGTAAALALLLAACGGGGGGGGGNLGAPTGPSNNPHNVDLRPFAHPGGSSGTWQNRNVTFSTTQAQLVRLRAEYGRNVTAFELHDLARALSSGITGAGTVVALVDSGIRTSHQEFAGTTIHTTGSVPVHEHGTFVASLIAGANDGRGMHGVAPGADLHFTALSPSGVGNPLDMANLVAGTNAAAGLGAVAQNNSWGFTKANGDSADRLAAWLRANPGASAAQGLNQTIGYTAPQWQAYINALDSFQQTGVIVWALSNDETITSGSSLASLPYFEPRLAEAWIAAANGRFTRDGSGNIVGVERLSAACGFAARFCVAGAGDTYGAGAGSDSAYSTGTGTSFVAPQISGTIALLAEAFPDLSPSDWTRRVLASADNSWFERMGVSRDGYVDFGNGVSHDYSLEWGHGVLDVAAALSPIGSIAVLAGTTVEDSERLTLAESALVAPAAFGDALSTGLADREMTVFDGLNMGFAAGADALVVEPGAPLLPTLMAAVSTDAEARARLRADVAGAAAPSEGLALGYARTGASALPDGAGGVSVLSGATNALSVAATGALGDARLTVHAVGAGFAADGDAPSHLGAGVTLAVPLGETTVSIGAGRIAERGLLGLSGSRAFDLGDAGTLTTVNLGLSRPLTETLTLFGGFEYGTATAGGSGGGALAVPVSGVTFSGLEIGASLESVMTSGDRFTLALRQPVRLETGIAEMPLPVGRNADGEIAYETASLDLAPSGRQLDLSLGYDLSLPDDALLRLGVTYSHDAGHVSGASAVSLAASFGRSF